jgi:hypothetical protein
MRSWREKDMKKQWFVRVVGLGALLFGLSGISSAVGEIAKSGGDEKPAMVTSETVSFATEDWVGVQEEAPVVAMGSPSFGTEDWVPEIALSEGERPVMEAMETPSFATEDWVGAQEATPVVAMETPSFGIEDWIGTMEYSHAVETGALSSAVPGEPWTGDNYSE